MKSAFVPKQFGIVYLPLMPYMVIAELGHQQVII